MSADTPLREPEGRLRPRGDGERLGVGLGDALGPAEASVLDRLELEDIVARQSESANATSPFLQIAVVAGLLAVFALLLVYG